MIDVIRRKIPRSALFLAFNISLVLFIVMFFLAPVLAHFASRSEDISENMAQLAHFQNIIRNATTLSTKSPKAGDPFLPGSEERIVSADLQASLKTIATSAGVNLLGVRGVQGSRSPQLRMVAVSVELEGPLPAVRDMILAIENQTPFLFVTAASLRSVTDADEGPIRAELKVQGAMRGGSLSSPAEAITQ